MKFNLLFILLINTIQLCAMEVAAATAVGTVVAFGTFFCCKKQSREHKKLHAMKRVLDRLTTSLSVEDCFALSKGGI